jgi:manganese/zinc/iron transport system permease protein
MHSLLEFFSFADANVRFVAFGSMLLAASSATVGCFTLLRQRTLVGDAVAHSVLPGVCLAFIIGESKNPLYLLIGAFATGWLSLVIIDQITRRSKLKEDTAISVVLSVFFGLGILLLTAIQHSGSAAQSGLDKFLFGKAASLVGEDLIVFGAVGVALVALVLLFFKELTLISFDKDFATSLGLPVPLMELLLTTLTVMAVVVGIQAVGVVLMAAMLITPAAAARFWTNDIRLMVLLAAAFGAFSGVSGAYISYVAPNMPTGPWIVMVVSVLAITSFMLAPGKGVIRNLLRQKANREQIRNENVLKAMFYLGEEDPDSGHDPNFYHHYTLTEIVARRPTEPRQLEQTLHRLRRKRMVHQIGEAYALTEAGRAQGQRLTKLHRLWEMYLTTYLNIAPDHVHDDAETIEHIITPEIEERLAELLNFPQKDPHGRAIRYE